MSSIIAHPLPKLIKNLTILVTLSSLGLVVSCLGTSPASPKEGILVTPGGKELKTQLAITFEEQSQGLSGVRPEDFSEDSAMLFVYDHEGIREFWMPDTYFNLDIFFLDQNLRIIDVERNVPAHPGRQEPIPRVRPVRSWHVLELKSSSTHARALRIGDTLKWKSSVDLDEIISDIRP